MYSPFETRDQIVAYSYFTFLLHSNLNSASTRPTDFNGKNTGCVTFDIHTHVLIIYSCGANVWPPAKGRVLHWGRQVPLVGLMRRVLAYEAHESPYKVSPPTNSASESTKLNGPILKDTN